jgi:chromosomal replication initiator protein
MQQFHKHITPDTIQQVVCAHFDISLGDLKSSKRKKMFVVPRQIAMYLARELTDYSFPELGSFLFLRGLLLVLLY